MGERNFIKLVQQHLHGQNNSIQKLLYLTSDILDILLFHFVSHVYKFFPTQLKIPLNSHHTKVNL